MSTTAPPLDLCGNPITLGSQVAFAWYHRDSCLAKGIVKKFTNKSIVVEPESYGVRKIVPQSMSSQQLVVLQ